jgi:hypothetical protein
MGMFKINFETIDGSIVMAAGIIVNGIAQEIPFLKNYLGSPLTLILVFVLLALYFKYAAEVFQGTFYNRRIKHPITSFSIGTLVAATSVTVMSISLELPGLKLAAYALFWINVSLWVLYFLLVLRNYRRLLNHKELVEQVHGVILLAGVTIQALVISGITLFGYSFPPIFAINLLLLGILTYVIGLIVLLVRFIQKPVSLADEWTNTNCIIHGAGSITGLTGIVSHVFPDTIAIAVWLWVLLCFLVIETIETIRVVLRVRKYGWKQGIFTYSTSQWARNFTFGMFLAFTIHLPQHHVLSNNYYFHEVHLTMIVLGSGIVFFLFLFELCLFAANLIVPGITKEKKYSSI